jgi:hypothetical protein
MPCSPALSSPSGVSVSDQELQVRAGIPTPNPELSSSVCFCFVARPCCPRKILLLHWQKIF